MPHALLALALWLSLLLSPAVPSPAYAADPLASSGQWGSVIDWGIFGKHMALLPNGNVLLAGSYSSTASADLSAELYY